MTTATLWFTVPPLQLDSAENIDNSFGSYNPFNFLSKKSDQQTNDFGDFARAFTQFGSKSLSANTSANKTQAQAEQVQQLGLQQLVESLKKIFTRTPNQPMSDPKTVDQQNLTQEALQKRARKDAERARNKQEKEFKFVEQTAKDKAEEQKQEETKKAFEKYLAFREKAKKKAREMFSPEKAFAQFQRQKEDPRKVIAEVQKRLGLLKNNEYVDNKQQLTQISEVQNSPDRQELGSDNPTARNVATKSGNAQTFDGKYSIATSSSTTKDLKSSSSPQEKAQSNDRGQDAANYLLAAVKDMEKTLKNAPTPAKGLGGIA